MSLTQALGNATQGLNATARATETIATNIANAQTEGYVRRSVTTSERVVDGKSLGLNPVTIRRNEADLASQNVRRADINYQYQSVITEASQNIQRVIGEIDSEFSLSNRMDAFQSAMKNLAETPENGSLQEQVVVDAKEFARTIREVALEIQKMREEADRSIKIEVNVLNNHLQQLQNVNSDILATGGARADISALQDQQERLLNSINEIIPVNARFRENGSMSVATKTGITLLDINVAQIEFTETPFITPEKVYAFEGEEPGLPFNAALSGLKVSGLDLTPTAGKIQSISGGKISGLFEIRDKFTTTIQRQLDSISAHLITSFREQDPTTDTDLASQTTGDGTVSLINATIDGSGEFLFDLTESNDVGIEFDDVYDTVLEFDDGTNSSALTVSISNADLSQAEIADTLNSILNAVKNGDALSTSTAYTGIDTDITFEGTPGVFLHNGATVTLSYNDNTGGANAVDEATFVNALNGSGNPIEDLDISNPAPGQILFQNNSITDAKIAATDDGLSSLTVDLNAGDGIDLDASDTYNVVLDFSDGTNSSALTASISGATLTRDELADTVSRIFNAVKNGDALSSSYGYSGDDTTISFGGAPGVFIHNGATIRLTYDDNTSGSGTINEATFVNGLNGSGFPAEDLTISSSPSGEITFSNNSLTTNTDQDFSVRTSFINDSTIDIDAASVSNATTLDLTASGGLDISDYNSYAVSLDFDDGTNTSALTATISGATLTPDQLAQTIDEVFNAVKGGTALSSSLTDATANITHADGITPGVFNHINGSTITLTYDDNISGAGTIDESTFVNGLNGSGFLGEDLDISNTVSGQVVFDNRSLTSNTNQNFSVRTAFTNDSSTNIDATLGGTNPTTVDLTTGSGLDLSDYDSYAVTLGFDDGTDTSALTATVSGATLTPDQLAQTIDEIFNAVKNGTALSSSLTDATANITHADGITPGVFNHINGSTITLTYDDNTSGAGTINEATFVNGLNGSGFIGEDLDISNTVSGQVVFDNQSSTLGSNQNFSVSTAFTNNSSTDIDATSVATNTTTLDLTVGNGLDLQGHDSYAVSLDFDNGTNTSALTATVSGADLTPDQLADTVNSILNAVKNGDALSTSTAYTGADTDITFGGSPGVFLHNGATVTLTYDDNTGGGAGTIDETTFVNGLNGSGFPAEDFNISNTTSGQVVFDNRSLTSGSNQNFSVRAVFTDSSVTDDVYQNFSISGTLNQGTSITHDSLFTAGDPGADYSTLESYLGIANSFNINSRFDPDQGGDKRRVRDGVGEENFDKAAGNGELLQSWISEMSTLKSFDASTDLSQSQSIVSSIREFISNSTLNNQNAVNNLEYEEGRRNSLLDIRDNLEGVNIDEQTQQMLLMQRIYQANAVLLKTVDEMMQTILNI